MAVTDITVNMGKTTDVGLSQELKAFYDTELLENARSELFCQDIRPSSVLNAAASRQYTDTSSTLSPDLSTTYHSMGSLPFRKSPSCSYRPNDTVAARYALPA